MSFSELLSHPVRRLYTFILKKLIGDYLEDELHQSQLDVKLSEGRLEIKDIKLDTEVLNESIPGLPFKITKAKSDLIRAEIPWDLTEKNCKITLKGLDVVIRRLDKVENPADNLSESLLQEALKQEGTSNFVLEHLRKSRDSRSSSHSSSNEDPRSTAGMMAIKGRLSVVLQRTEFFVEDFSIRFQHYNSSLSASEVVIRLSHLKYINSTESSTSTKQSGKFEKEFKFRGLRVDLVRDRKSITIAHGHVDKYSTFSFTPPPIIPEGKSTTRIEVEGIIPALRVLVGPSQIEHIKHAFSDILESLRILKKNQEKERIDDDTTQLTTGPKDMDMKHSRLDDTQEIDKLIKLAGLKKGTTSPRSRIGKPIKAEEYGRLENMLREHEHKKTRSGAAMAESMADSFATAISHGSTSTEFYDCVSGSNSVAVDPAKGERKEVLKDFQTEFKTELVSLSAGEISKRKIITWNFKVHLQRASVVILHDDVDRDRWLPDFEWYLSPISLPPIHKLEPSFGEKLHPSPGVFSLRKDHYAVLLDDVSATIEHSPIRPFSDLSVLTVKVVEYLLHEEKERSHGVFQTAHGAFRCAKLVNFGEAGTQDVGSCNPEPSVDGCESDEDDSSTAFGEQDPAEEKVDERSRAGVVEGVTMAMMNSIALDDDDLHNEPRAASAAPPEPPISTSRNLHAKDIKLFDIDFDDKTPKPELDECKGEMTSSTQFLDFKDSSPMPAGQEGKATYTAQRIQQEIKQSIPDLKISVREAKRREGSDSKNWHVELRMLPVNIQMDLGTIQRMKTMQKNFSNSREESFSHGWGLDSKNDTKSLAESGFSARSPSSSQESLDINQIRNEQEQVLLFPDERGTDMKSGDQFVISTPLLKILLLPNLSGRGGENLEVSMEDLHISNTITDAYFIKQASHIQNLLIYAQSSSMRGILNAGTYGLSGRGRTQTDFTPVLEIEAPRLCVNTRSDDSTKTAIFHPFLAPGTKIAAHETEAFFQRLWDPFRVWEADERKEDSRRSRPKSKNIKSLTEFERTCQSQATFSLTIQCKTSTLALPREGYVDLHRFLRKISTEFSERNFTPRRSSPSKSFKPTLPLLNPQLLPQYPEHVPTPQQPEPIQVKVSKRQLLAASHHKMAISATFGVMVIKIAENPMEGKERMSSRRHSPRKGFELRVEKFRAFHLLKFNHEDTNYLSLDFGRIQLLAVSLDTRGETIRALPVLFNTMAGDHGCKKTRKQVPNRHIAQLIHVNSTSKNGEDQIQTALNLNSVTLEAPRIDLLNQWLELLTKFFAPSTQRETREEKITTINRKDQTSFLYIHATDCALDYNPPSNSGRGVLVFTRISMRMCDLDKTEALHISIDLSDLRCYLTPSSSKPKPIQCAYKRLVALQEGRSDDLLPHELPEHLCSLPGDSLIAYLEHESFVRVVNIDAFKMCIHLLPKSEDARRLFLRSDPFVADTTVELTRGALSVEVCSDSCAVLSGLGTQIVEELTPVEQEKEFEVSFQHKGSLLGDIDQKAFNDETVAKTAVLSSANPHSMLEAERTYRRCLVKDYFQKDRDVERVERRVTGIDLEQEASWTAPVSLQENHFILVSETDRIYKAKRLHPPRSHPRPKFTFKMHSVKIQARLYGGKDFAKREDSKVKVNELRDPLAGLKARPHLIREDTSTISATGCVTLAAARLKTVNIQQEIPEEKGRGLDAFVQDSWMGKENLHEDESIRSRTSSNDRKSSDTKIPQDAGSSSMSARSGNELLQILLGGPAVSRREGDPKGIHMIFNAYPATSRVASYIALTIDDVDIKDMIKSSEFHGNHLLSYDPPTNTLRESGSSMVRIKLTNIRPDPKRYSQRQEARVYVQFLPVHFRLDQDTLEFALKFAKGLAAADHKRFDSSTNLSTHLPDDDEKIPPQTYLQSFKIEECKICLDYRPKRIDLDALRAGEYSQLAHLLRLEEIRISLSPKTLNAVKGWGALAAQLGKDWSDEVLGKQLHRCLAGIQPLRSIIKVGSGVVDLVAMPLEQFRRDGRLLRGIKNGIFAFLNSLTLETINVATSLAVNTHNLVKRVDGAFGGKADENRNSDEKSRHHSRTASHRADNSAAPRDLRDGLQQALDAFSGGMKDAARKIVFVPADRLNAGEYKGAVSSVVTAVPSAVVRSMAGVTEGVSKVLIGAKKSADDIVGENKIVSED
ncbi:hypothetical protein AAMO2058_000108300 [Amorphochlora amoebiformis]